MDMRNCEKARQGRVAFQDGKGISDNPWVSGYSPPYTEANQWMSGYLTEKLRQCRVVSDAAAWTLGQVLWEAAEFPIKHNALCESINLLTQSTNRRF